MTATTEDYVNLLRELLPKGVAWNTAPESNLTAVLTGVAAELTRAHIYEEDITREANPRFCTSTLEKRYEEAGLPFICTGRAPTAAQRKNEVLGVWAATGGQNLPYYRRVLIAHGYKANVIDCVPFRVGRSAVNTGVFEPSESWKYQIFIIGYDNYYKHFNVGDSVTPDRLREWTQTALPCILDTVKPAHCNLNFILVPDTGDIVTGAGDVGHL